ncbi:MAG: uroporphyrinogen-III C-methyltransferase [Bacteroidota bacterium]|nr:uroporphyrinogen-III C-methyltransferase [Bacteroidota bacterium]
MNQLLKTGKVIIAGAGPGDPELVTVKTTRYLQKADVVLVDRLVSNEILNQYVSPDAEIIHVGKQCRRGISTPQETINDLMVHHALLGKLVVRLKGGDVSIFSNILDELETLAAHNIPYEIIPGVTAALGAAAFAGIPLTARGYATSVRFLTCYKSEIVSDEYWKELAQTSDTIVFYMSAETLPMIVKNLTDNNIDENKLLAIIEQATTPFQNIHVTNLYDYKNNFGEKIFISPSLVIIGEVVSLHEKYKWLQNHNTSEYYFKPIASIHQEEKIALPC